MKKTFLSVLLSGNLLVAGAQATSVETSRPLTLLEYGKAKGYIIKDLDNQTYAKFDNNYILDRYEMRKPYFITGDDGLKKRVDLYKLVSKDGMQVLGTMIFYTNEQGKLYTAIQPNFNADPKVWNQYFEDIHAIDKEEKNFILKLSYVLSKEMSFQLYKSMNSGKDMKAEMATYGTDICFPGDQEVAMADGSVKQLRQVKSGDVVITVDPVTKKSTSGKVARLVEHEAKNYAITKLLVVASKERKTAGGFEVQLTSKLLSATPNHPMATKAGQKKMGNVAIGDEVVCLDPKTKEYVTYTVYNKNEYAGGVQKVYNIEVNSGSTYLMNGVMVMQK